MTQVVIMPKLGLTMTHGVITRWAKKEGEQVKAGEILFELETDKINTEVEAPADGFVLKILAKEGEDKEITAPVCILGDKDDIAALPEESSSLDKESRKNGKSGEGGPEDGSRAGTVIKDADRDALEVKISPIAKKLALENGIDYRSIRGSGPEGRIVKEDILAAMEPGKAVKPEVEGLKDPSASKRDDSIGKREPSELKPEALPAGQQGTASPGQKPEGTVVQPIQNAGFTEEGVIRTPLTGIRKVIAERLSKSKQDIPHVYFKSRVDVTELLKFKDRLAAELGKAPGKKLSFNDLVIKAAASALEGIPGMNVSLAGDEILRHRQVNIGIAVNSDRGLLVPVLKNASNKSIGTICREAGELIEKARSGKLSHDDISGGTFTVSNLGAYRIDEFAAIINPPESAILAVGRAAEAPAVYHGALAVRWIANLTLSVDHRVIDGVLAAQFMKRLRDLMEEPYLLLL